MWRGRGDSSFLIRNKGVESTCASLTPEGLAIYRVFGKRSASVGGLLFQFRPSVISPPDDPPSINKQQNTSNSRERTY
ncbi:hypothetical protein J6590_039498 [Homalodisca vitripennis]|nr:hypothetical protein J6590_039498 [Homalodisca vitripennis]